jgi:3',5'-cyclic AMP phosphodiesterase CpdA
MMQHPVASLPRRRFLISAAAGAGALVLRPQCLVGEERRRPLSFIVVSDTHLGYRDQKHAEEQWAKAAAEIREAEGAFVLHLGDVVDGGREEQYPKYTAIRSTIEKPVYEIPGNHDPQPLFEKHVRSPVETALEQDWLRVLLLNNSRTDSHDGFLSPEQIAWIDEQCREAKDRRQIILLCMHVPAHTNRHPDRGWHVKPEHGQGELYELIDRHKDSVLSLFHGHFHNGLRGWDDRAPVHEIAFPSVLYNRDRRLEAQNAPGYNLPEFRPGYALVKIEADAMTLKYKPLGNEASAEKTCATPQAE